MDDIMPAQFDELFDNYIHVTQRLERSACPTFDNMMMYLHAMEYFRCILNERLYSKASQDFLKLLHETGIDYQGYRFWFDDVHQLRVNQVPKPVSD